MFPIKCTRRIKVYSPITRKMELQIKCVCVGRNGREIVRHWDGYFYLNKDNTISKRRYDIEKEDRRYKNG